MFLVKQELDRELVFLQRELIANLPLKVICRYNSVGRSCHQLATEAFPFDREERLIPQHYLATMRKK